MKLLIVRHAESQGNATGNYSVKTHDSLSSRGRKQAVALGRFLMPANFDLVVVSPLQRALETIAPYLKATNRQAEIMPQIAEGCCQAVRQKPSRSWKSRPASVPPRLKKFFTWKNNEKIRPAGGFGEGLCRVHETKKWIESKAHVPDLSILMVTHGHFIRELLNVMLRTRRLVRFPHDNCGMTSLTFADVWMLEYCNRSRNEQ